MIDIAFLGECMLEEQADGEFRFGGDTLNTALYLARLTGRQHVRVHYATAVGTDSDSQLLLSCWHKEGIDTAMVTQSVDRQLGRYRIRTNLSGERKFSYQRDQSAARYYFQSNPGVFKQFLSGAANRYLYLSGISLAIISVEDRSHLFDLIGAFKKHGGKVIFDNNFRPILWKLPEVEPCYNAIMALADIAFLTDDDEYALYPDCHTVEDILARTTQLGIGEVVIKQGGKPCIISQAGQLFEVSATAISPQDIVDTSAAGDSFAAGYLAKRLLGQDPIQAARYGHLVASEVIQHAGAIIAKSAMKKFIQ